jgi:hypothetical protein
MPNRIEILAFISLETFQKFARLGIPSRKNGHRRKPEFWGRQLEKYSQTLEFQLIERDLDIQAANRKASNAEFVLKIEKDSSKKKDIEIERLKTRIRELESNLVKDAA